MRSPLETASFATAEHVTMTGDIGAAFMYNSQTRGIDLLAIEARYIVSAQKIIVCIKQNKIP